MDFLEAGNPEQGTLVLLHGMGTGASAWQPQLEALGEHYHILAPSLPGYGSQPGPFTLTAASEAVATLISEWAQPVHLCGLSLGALVALELTHAYPTLVHSLVLSAGFVSLAEEVILQRQTSAEIVRNFDPSTFSEVILPQLVEGVPEAYRAQALAEVGNLTPESLADLIELEFDARAWIGSVDVPTLVLCGDQDEPNLPLSQELAGSLSHATFETVPNAGHVANLDAPDAFTGKLEGFMQRTHT